MVVLWYGVRNYVCRSCLFCVSCLYIDSLQFYNTHLRNTLRVSLIFLALLFLKRRVHDGSWGRGHGAFVTE